MVLPPELTRLLHEAGKELARDACGALPLARRQEIWSALGPVRHRGRRALRGPGLQRRFALAGFCVRRVLPLWKAELPKDDMPRRLLQAGEDYLAKRIDAEEAEALIDLGWAHGDEIDSDLANREGAQGVNVGLVCHAASRALRVAVRDEQFDPKRPPPEWIGHYGSFDPESMDASYIVVAVVTGRWPNEKGSDVEQRRAFWRWYLQKGVTRAWASA